MMEFNYYPTSNQNKDVPELVYQDMQILKWQLILKKGAFELLKNLLIS